jgi:DNA-binding response OmpR family regulator
VIGVTARQARLFAALAPAMPQVVDRAFLIKKIWAGQRIPEFAEQILGALVRDSAVAAASIGLSINSVRGVGVALQAKESGHA